MANTNLINSKTELDRVEFAADDDSLEKYLTLNAYPTSESFIRSGIDNPPSDMEAVDHIKYRILKDTSTDSVTSWITKNLNNGGSDIMDLVLYFQSYTYHHLLSNINKELNEKIKTNTIEINFYPLLDDEELNIYFKGGTLMRFYKLLLEKEVGGFDNPDLSDDLKEKLTKNFKISDIDMNLYIKTASFKRFDQLKYCAVKLLSKQYRQLSEILDKLYAEDECNEQPDNDGPELQIMPNANTIDILKKLISNFKKLLIKEGNKHDLNKFIDLNCFEPFNSVYINSIILEYFTFIKYYEGLSLNEDFKTKLNEKIDNLIKINVVLLEIELCKVKDVFVNKKDLLDELVKNFTQTFEDIGDNTIYNHDTTPPVKYKVNQAHEFVKDDIKLDVKRGDLGLGSSKYVNTTGLLVEFESEKNQHKHYVSYNNSINVFMHNKLLSFSLIRIKQIIKINNDVLIRTNSGHLQALAPAAAAPAPAAAAAAPAPAAIANTDGRLLYIPSEILDLSITNIYDSYKYGYKVNDQFRNYYHVTDENKIMVFDNEENLIQDLLFILFSQRGAHIPWMDLKYSKRLFRVFFLMKAIEIKDKMMKANPNIYENINNIIKDLIDSLTILQNNLTIDNDKYNDTRAKILINNSIPLDVLIDYIDKISNREYVGNNIYQINNIYYPVKDLLSYILVSVDILFIKKEDAVYIKIMKKISKIYNIINMDIDNADFIGDYKKKFVEFIGSVKENIELIEEINNLINP